MDKTRYFRDLGKYADVIYKCEPDKLILEVYDQHNTYGVPVYFSHYNKRNAYIDRLAGTLMELSEQEALAIIKSWEKK